MITTDDWLADLARRYISGTLLVLLGMLTAYMTMPADSINFFAILLASMATSLVVLSFEFVLKLVVVALVGYFKPSQIDSERQFSK